ncbi:MAG: DUF3800 domain-containing protein [Candidatus Hydrogenedentes bacterium]|nr:DUF3800 domain-containing protein [Candidatus Hydrogenedentota bacterium]
MIDTCLSSSRFIAFLDECGDHSLTKINAELPVFALCTVIVERAVYAKQIVPALASLKLRYFPHEGVNLHSRDIRKSEGPFTILQNANVRERFLGELSDMVATLPFTLFVTAIHKIRFRECYGDRAKNPYDVALEYSFERVLHFMESNNESHLPVIAEARGRNEDNELRASFHELMTKGTFYQSATRFRQLVCPLVFRRKNDNIAGIQLADLCAYPVARHVVKPLEKSRTYDVVQKHFYRAGSVIGLKVFPK